MQTTTMMNTTARRSRRTRRFYLNLVARALALAGALPALAVTWTVNNLNDSGLGSLRDAIAGASAGDTIQFGPSVAGTITLTSGELLISKNLTINGPGASQLAISGNKMSRIFEISSGATITVSGLTIENGSTRGIVPEGGGGIFNNGGTLTVTDSVITGNIGSFGPTSGAGGGIYNYGTLTVTNSTFSGNSAVNGGGIYSYSYDNRGTAIIINSTFSGNSVSNGGPTQTIALLPTSPAVDAIPAANCTDTNGNPVETDQRGVARPQGVGCDVGAFELVPAVPFSAFSAHLVLLTGHPSGFHLTSRFTLGEASQGLQPLNEVVTLQIAHYSVTLPAGSLHARRKGPHTRYEYEGTVSGTHLVLDLFSLDGNRYEFKAAGSPVAWTDIQNPVTVALSIGPDTGSTTVNAFILPY